MLRFLALIAVSFALTVPANAQQWDRSDFTYFREQCSVVPGGSIMLCPARHDPTGIAAKAFFQKCGEGEGWLWQLFFVKVEEPMNVYLPASAFGLTETCEPTQPRRPTQDEALIG